MKAITIWEPHATLVAERIKINETRLWAPPRSLIGQRLAIHAGKSRESMKQLNDAISRGDREWQPIFEALLGLYGAEWQDAMSYGKVVAVATLSSVERTTSIEPDPFGDYSPGRYAWVLSSIIPLGVEAKGAQGIWDWDPPEEIPLHNEHAVDVAGEHGYSFYLTCVLCGGVVGVSRFPLRGETKEDLRNQHELNCPERVSVALKGRS